LYKSEDPVFPENPKPIIDFLMSGIKGLIENCLAEFHDAIPDPPQWDDDLVVYYKHARRVENEDLKSLLDQLDKDLKKAKPFWAQKFHQSYESGQVWTLTLLDSFEKFQAIQPQTTNPLALCLNPPF
jgi:hypothetical protein